MSNSQKLTALICFGVSMSLAVVAAGTWSPVLFGVGEVTPRVSGTGWVSTLLSVVSGLGGAWAIFQKGSGPIADLLKSSPQLAALLTKAGIDPAKILSLLSSGKNTDINEIIKLITDQKIVPTPVNPNPTPSPVTVTTVDEAFEVLFGVAGRGLVTGKVDQETWTLLGTLRTKFSAEVSK